MEDQHIKILLVEDNPDDAHLLREMLTEVTAVQFALAHVERLDEALKRLGEERFDVTLLDLALPDSQGLDTLRQTHSQAPDVPIVVLTGLDDETIAVQAVQLGAHDYLIKGQVSGRSLVRVMRYAIARQQMWAEVRASEAHPHPSVEEKVDAAHDASARLDSPEAVLAIMGQCLDPDAATAQGSRQVIANLVYPDFVELLHSILEAAATDTTARRLFQILSKLKGRDLLKYTLSFRETDSGQRTRRTVLARWLTELGLVQQYVKVILNLPGVNGLNPSATAISSFRILVDFDPDVVVDLAKLVKTVSPEEAIKGLGILTAIAQGNDRVDRLLLGTMTAPDGRLRSKVIKTLTTISAQKIAICRRVLQDEDGRVRANAIEPFWGTPSPNLRGLFEPCLEDISGRVQANAARVFHDLADPRGVDTLIAMLDSSDEAQASGAWILGEVKEMSAINRLKALAETGSESVARNATLALQKIGSEATNL